MKSITEKFNEIVAECEKDPNVLGLVLGGSQGKGFITEHSDYDFELIVKDEIEESYRKQYDDLSKSDAFDICVTTLENSVSMLLGPIPIVGIDIALLM